MKDLNRLHDIEEEIMALLDEAVEDARLGSEEKIDLFFVIGSILDDRLTSLMRYEETDDEIVRKAAEAKSTETLL